MASSQWIAYATAGAATALGATTAEAEIHYSGIINVLVSFDEKTFPLSNGAVLWFEHSQTTTCYTRALFQLRSAAVSNGWQSEIVYGVHVPKNLPLHQPISTENFWPGVGVLGTSPFCFAYQFCQRGYGFLGFEFNTGLGTQYGWIRLRMRGERYCTRSPGVSLPFDAFYVVEYAWADPGEHIRVGQRHSPSQEEGAVSPSGSLGLLALGKVGLELWRAQRLSSSTAK